VQGAVIVAAAKVANETVLQKDSKMPAKMWA